MGYLADEIIEASQQLGDKANIINLQESQKIVKEIENRFFSNKSFYGYPLGEHIQDTI